MGQRRHLPHNAKSAIYMIIIEYRYIKLLHIWPRIASSAAIPLSQRDTTAAIARMSE
jgi:hypothetical protein